MTGVYEDFYERVMIELNEEFPHVPVTFNWEWNRRSGRKVPQFVKHLAADMIPTWAGAANRHYASAGVPFVYMTGRFIRGLSDWSNTTPESLRLCTASTVATGGRFYIIDRQLADGILEERSYDMMKAVFPLLQERHDWLLGAQAARETVLLWDEQIARGKDRVLFSQKKPIQKRCCRYESAVRVLQDHGRHFVASGFERFKELSAGVKVLILPESSDLDEATLAYITEWVEQGGNVSMTLPAGSDGVDAGLMELAGLNYEGMTPYKYHYAETQPDYWDTVGIPQIRATISADNTETVVRAGKPLEVHPGDYRYGHGYAPFDGASEFPWATERRLGKGKVVCVTMPIFDSLHEYEWPNPTIERLLIQLLDRVSDEILVAADSEYPVELGYTRKGEDLVIHLVNRAGRIEKGGQFFTFVRCLPPIDKVTVTLKKSASGTRVLEIPSEQPVRTTEADSEHITFEAAGLKDLLSFAVPGYFAS